MLEKYKNVKIVDDIENWKNELIKKYNLSMESDPEVIVKKFVNYIDSKFTSSYWGLNLKFLESSEVVVAYKVKSEKNDHYYHKYYSVFDFLSEKTNGKFTANSALEEIKSAPEISRSSWNWTRSDREAMNRMSALGCVLLTYYAYTEQYKKSIMLIKTFYIKSSKNSISVGLTDQYHYNGFFESLPVDIIAQHILMLAGGMNDKSFKTSAVATRMLRSYCSFLQSNIGEINSKVLSNDTLKEAHKSIMRSYSKSISNIMNLMTPEILNLSMEAIESSPKFVETLVSKLDYYLNYRGRGEKLTLKQLSNDWDLSNYKFDKIKPSEEHKEYLMNVFKNYFFTKYGRGQKYAGLEKSIKVLTTFLECFGYEVNILDLVEGLPEKIQLAALKGQLGAF